MSHKIIAFAPLHQNGATTVSILLSQALTYANMRALYTFTAIESLAPKYINVQNLSDPTRSVTQLVKLIDMGALKPSDILDYANPFAKNAYVMDLSNKILADKNQRQVVRHVFHYVPTDVVVCDDSTDSDNTTSQALVEDADQIFLVITPSEKNYQQLRAWLELPYLKNRKDVYVILNYYNEALGSVRDIARKLGISPSHLCKVHYNPYIANSCLTGELANVVQGIEARDPRVTNLIGDMKELVSCVRSVMSAKRRR